MHRHRSWDDDVIPTVSEQRVYEEGFSHHAAAVSLIIVRVQTQECEPETASLATKAGDLLTSWVDRLPSRLRRILPRELVGFALLGTFTFLIDLGILAILRTWGSMPLPMAVTIAYVVAFSINFVLNRTINFRSHAPVGGQVLRYAVTVGCDYGLTLGVTTGLTALGIDFRLARLTAAASVAIFTYTASRWWVFRDRSTDTGEKP